MFTMDEFLLSCGNSYQIEYCGEAITKCLVRKNGKKDAMQDIIFVILEPRVVLLEQLSQ
jgi:hypothetical protein